MKKHVSDLRMGDVAKIRGSWVKVYEVKRAYIVRQSGVQVFMPGQSMVVGDDLSTHIAPPWRLVSVSRLRRLLRWHP